MKCGKLVELRSGYESLPVRGAWIEILAEILNRTSGNVAPRAGSVD